ncbi:MAG TPA: DUF3108 domain-containing protein [Ramlibacter sp.]|nr:DUF3108 domain-containing protein [Ramlibacter sp.]
MTDRQRLTWRLALLAAVVLAIHLWLLGGVPKVIVPEQRATPFVAHTVAPPKVARSEVPKPSPPPVVKKRAAPPPAAEAATKRAEPPQVATANEVPTSAPAATHASGAAAVTRFLVLPSSRLHYDVTAQSKGFILKGQAELDWHNDGDRYEARMNMSSPLPFVKPREQRSTGLVTAMGLAPERFSDKVRSEEAAHFDREQGKVTFSTNKPDAALEPGAQDRLSIVLQLGAMIAGNPSKYPVGSQITVQTASTKEAEPWSFTVQAKETLDLPGGRTTALRLTRNPRKEYDVKVELWLAPGHAYAPVRLRLTQPNGDWVDQQWSSTDRG